MVNFIAKAYDHRMAEWLEFMTYHIFHTGIQTKTILEIKTVNLSCKDRFKTILLVSPFYQVVTCKHCLCRSSGVSPAAPREIITPVDDRKQKGRDRGSGFAPHMICFYYIQGLYLLTDALTRV